MSASNPRRGSRILASVVSVLTGRPSVHGLGNLARRVRVRNASTVARGRGNVTRRMRAPPVERDLSGCIEYMKRTCGEHNATWSKAYKKCVASGILGCIKTKIRPDQSSAPGGLPLRTGKGIPSRRMRARQASRRRP